MQPLRCRAALLLAVLLPAIAQAAPAAKAPDRDPVLASALIPDLDRLLGHIEAAGAVVSPGAVMPGMMKGMLAGQLGDPGLASLGQGPIMGVMMQGTGGAPQFALFIPVRGQAPYAAAFTKQGWKTKMDKGLLAAAATQEALDAAWGVQASYRALAKAPAVAHDLRLEFQADRLAATYGPMMEMGLGSMMASRSTPPAGAGGSSSAPGAPNTAQLQKVLALEMKALLAVFTSTESLRWDLDVDAAALSGGMALKLKPGTPLAALATMPVSGPNPARGLIFEPGLMSSESRMDPKKVTDFLGQLLDEMARNPETAEFASADIRTLVGDMGRCSTGQMAYSLRPGAAGVWGTAETAMTVGDENACLSMMEKGINLVIGPGSTFQKMYQDMGMDMSLALQKKARMHGGVAVHRLKMAMKASPAAKAAPGSKGTKPAPGAKPGPDLSNPMLASMMRDTEFAFSHGYYVSSQDPARLDKLIDLAAAGPRPPADSGSELLPDANMALSYDFAGLMKATMASLPPDAKGAANPFANLPPSEPVRFAMTLNQGQVDSRWRMPLAPLAAMAQSAKAASGGPSPKPPAAKKP